MSVTIDIIFAVLCAAVLVWYTWRGFFKALTSIVRLVASVLFSWLLTPLFFGDSQTLKILGYLIVFVAFYIVLSLVLGLLNRFLKNTKLKTANRILGFLLGCVCAYFFLSAAAMLVTVLANIKDGAFLGVSQAELCESAHLYGFFEKFGIFALINK